MMNARRALDQALTQGGEVLKKHFGKAKLEFKGRANIVTQADVQSQRAILDVLKRLCPEHDYKAEESGVRETGSDYLWLIDPLDGTTNYAHGYPASCVSIGLLHRGKPLLGGVLDPFRGERFTAERGKGARMNGRRLKVSAPARLEDSLLVTGFAYDRGEDERSRFYVELYRKFMVRCHDVRRSGAASLDLAWIAAGRADGFWESGLSPWDVAAGWLLVEEAGGKVSDFSGRPWTDVQTLGRQTLATNGRVHDAMLGIIRRHL
jgi:myo-inositol-1(or 4)-monophosphatase